MAIKKSFGGRTIRKPGAYSRSKVDNSAGAAIESNNTLFLIGEALEGAPGDVEGIQSFSAAQVDQLVAKYKSGPIVDCALAALRPSQTPGIGGAGQILVWKTNSATQASKTFQNSSPANLLVLKDRQWGSAGNDLSVTIVNGSSSQQKSFQINKLNDVAEVIGENAGLAALSIQYVGDATTASMTISGASKAAKVLAVTLAGDQTDGSDDLSINLNAYNMKQLVDFIDAQVGYNASIVYTPYSVKSGTELDSLGATSILTLQSLYRNQEEIVEMINLGSSRVEASLSSTPVSGLPANVSNVFLTGGAQGASINSDFSNGMAQSLAEDYNVLLPCVSRDASDDIADSEQGFTDASSTYTIASILSAADAHLRLRSQIENRKEAQGMGGVRELLKADAFSLISGIGSELMQICMQDVYVLNEQSSLEWKHPHVMAALCAGIRLGTEVGEPMTFKRLNCLGIGHYMNPVTGLQLGNFNYNLDSNDAIDNGVLYAEKSGSIFRIVVDNTTYGTDESFVYNRGSVVEAAQFVAKDLRKLAEQVFVGNKVSNGLAKSIKSVLRARLLELNADDVNIITSSIDAPNGFVEETFTVEVEGNTAKVQVEVKPVQGLDFLFISFTLGDIKQSA